MPNKWVDYVKRWAKKNNMSYGCALSDPQLKIDYRKSSTTTKQERDMMGGEDRDAPEEEIVVNYVPKKKKSTKKLEAKEREMMGAEDRDAPEEDEVYNVFDWEIDIKALSKELDEELTKGKLKTIKEEIAERKELYEDLKQTDKRTKMLRDLMEKYNEKKRAFSKKEIKKDDKYFEEKYGKDFRAIKDKLDNYIIYVTTPLDTRGIERPNGKFISFRKDSDELTDKEEKLYEPYLGLIEDFVIKKLEGKTKITDYQMGIKMLNYIQTKMK